MENRQRLIAAAQLLLLLAVTTAAAAAAHRPPRYRTAAARDPAKLNVHIVCHSHDDSGWLKTVDQYYWGANNTIQVAGVQYILDTVVQALAANPDRKFIYSEMSFFERWWGQQDEDTRALVTRLVQDGQLEFVNGGYVQHDEATAHYVAMIDQTTRGHSFLKRTFGAIPRVGWQIDPFGHSSTQAGLLSAQVGFDALFFGRADYQDMEYRKGIRAMELVWRGSNSLEDADVFTSNFASGNYGPPEGFAYEWAAPPIMDDPHLDEYNVQERVDAFVEQCRALANVTRGNDIMLTIGSDFQFANAHLQYKNLDKLIHYANADGRLNAFHSTPTAYAAAKHGYDTKWPLKQDDFFPYADFPHSYWTGYFTSRAASKGFIRAATSYLQAARQLEAFMGRPELDAAGPTTDALEEAVSLLQHHDAVTGTEKEHVTCDYHRRLARSLNEAQALVNSALERLIRGQTRPGGSAAVGTSKDSPDTAAPSVVAAAKQDDTAHLAVSQRRLQDASSSSSSSAAAAAGGNPVDMPVPLHSCNWLNVSACNTTVRLSAAGKGVLLAAYNPLAWSREVPLRVPLNTSKTCAWKVTGPEGEEVASQLVGVAPGTWCLQQLLAGVNATCPATFGDVELAFIARLPPLGYSTFYLEPQPDAACTPSSSSTRDAQRSCGTGLHSTSSTAKTSGSSSAAKGEKYEKLDNGLVTLEFDTETGLLARVTAGGVSARLSTGFAWYNSSTDAAQPSGAYIFRPNGSYPLPEEEASGGSWWQCLWGGSSNGACGKGGKPAVQLEIVRGETVSEARQSFAGWATLVTRLYRGQSHVEVEWTVGPIPFEDGLGREVVLQYTSDLDSGEEFWTDANGREMIRRIRDFRPSWELNLTEPIASNFYPLTAAIYIQDEERQLALLTDRAQGGASLSSGQMEVMVHRRTMEDDFRGVAEPLNETACGCTQCNCPGLVVHGRHWLLLAPRAEAAHPRRTLQQELNDPPVLAFGAVPHGVGSDARLEGRTGLRRTWSLSEGHIMHSNVHLLTLKDTGSSYLVRLAHLYQEGEDPSLAKPVTENLNAVLQLLEYSAIEELSLSGNQRRSDMLRRRLRFKAGDSLTNSTWLEGSGSSGSRSAAAATAAELAGAGTIDCRSGCRNGELLVTLKPMEVRTFNLLYKPY